MVPYFGNNSFGLDFIKVSTLDIKKGFKIHFFLAENDLNEDSVGPS